MDSLILIILHYVKVIFLYVTFNLFMIFLLLFKIKHSKIIFTLMYIEQLKLIFCPKNNYSNMAKVGKGRGGRGKGRGKTNDPDACTVME